MHTCDWMPRNVLMWPAVPTVGRVTIDHDGDVPYYVQLAGILRAQIDGGEIRPHRPIPSKRYLTETHGVSAGTVEKALGLLKAEGYLRTVRGKGLYVVPEGERGRQE